MKMDYKNEHPLTKVYWLTYFWLIFSIIFVGDFQVPQYGYYGFWIVVIIGLPFLIRPKSIILLYATLSGPLALIILFGITYKNIDEAYYQAPLFSVISVIYLGKLKILLESPRKDVYLSTVSLLLFFFVFLLLSDSSSSRTSMVFGPTILYRVILFFYAYCLIYLLHHDRTFTAIAITCITFYAVLKIGSRGGIIAIGVIWLILIIRYLSINFLIKMLVALMLLWYFLDWEEIFSSRAFYFSSDSESTNIRLDKLSMVEQFLNSKEIWFGMSNPSALVGNYPHNIFAEILIYHGLIAFGIFFVLNMISLYIVFRNFSQKKWIFNFALLFAPIFVGAQFSGNLLDNYFYITAMAFLIITHASKYTTIKFSLNQKKSALCASNKF